MTAAQFIQTDGHGLGQIQGGIGFVRRNVDEIMTTRHLAVGQAGRFGAEHQSDLLTGGELLPGAAR